MTNPASLFPASGGGSPAYFSGGESYHDLSGASYVGAVSDLGLTHVLYSSTEGKSFKLCAANASGVTVGKAIGFRVLPGSKPIKILNAGTAGTDPILEAFLLPGAEYTLFANSVGGAAGNWRGRGLGAFHGPVPVTLPLTQDTGVDLGSAPSGSGASWIDVIAPNRGMTRMDSTHYACAVVPAAATSVVAYALTYNHATDAWTWGAANTVFSSANVWALGGIVGFATPSFAVVAWEATNAKMSVRGATVAGVVATLGTTAVSGAWAINPSGAGSATISTTLADAAATFFHACAYDGTHLGILHFSGMGTANVVVDGGSAFGSSAPPLTANTCLFGYSPGANLIELGIDSVGSASGAVARYTYAASAVTNTFSIVPRNNSVNFNGALQCVDTANRIFYLADVATTALGRCRLNAGNSEVAELTWTARPVTDAGVQASALGSVLFITDDEALVYTAPGTPTASFNTFTLFNPQIGLRARNQIPATTSTDSGFANHIVSASMGFCTAIARMLGFDLNSTNRRAAVVYQSATQALTTQRELRAQMFDLPRNYDQAIS